MSEPMSDVERDDLMGLADDARGQAGGLTREDQARLGALALQAWSEEVEHLRAELRRLRAFEDEVFDQIRAGNKDALWTYLVAGGRAYDRLGGHRDAEEPGEASAHDLGSETQAELEVRALARIVDTVASLQLAAGMTDEVAYLLHAAVEGEHRFVSDAGDEIIWPEHDLAEVAAQLEARLQTVIDGSSSDE